MHTPQRSQYPSSSQALGFTEKTADPASYTRIVGFVVIEIVNHCVSNGDTTLPMNQDSDIDESDTEYTWEFEIISLAKLGVIQSNCEGDKRLRVNFSVNTHTIDETTEEPNIQ